MNNINLNVRKDIVLMTAVGNRDPLDEKTKEAGPVLEYLTKVRSEPEWQHIRPKYVYLLHTSSKRDDAERLAAEIKDGITHVNLLELTTNDPTDFTILLDQMGRHAYETTMKHIEDSLTVLVSPGTSQMNAVWLVLGNEGRLSATFFQKVENRFTKNGKGIIRPIRFEPLFESETIKLAIQLLKRYDFDGASHLFKKLTKSANPRRSEIAQFMSHISAVYADWDLFNYRNAKEKLTGKDGVRVPDELRTNTAFAPLLEAGIAKQFTILPLLDGGDIQTQVVDLLCSAERFRHTKRHIDSIWRCATAYEVMLRRTLAEKYGVATLRYGRNNYGDTPQMQERLRGHVIVVGTDQLTGAVIPDAGMLRIDAAGLLPQIDRVRRDRIDALHFGRASRESGAAVSATRAAVALFFDIEETDIDAHPMSSKSLSKVSTALSLLFRRHS